MKALLIGALISIGATSAMAAGGINKDYVRSLAAPGRIVLVMEYYDGRGNVASRKGFASAKPYQALSATTFAVDANMKVNLYGVVPCEGDFVNRREDYAGSCASFAQQQFQNMLNGSKVIFCRAFMTEEQAPVQNATCYSWTAYPGSMDAVDMIEEQLVSIGAVKVVQKPDGTSERKDLLDAQNIAVGGKYGMWADQRQDKQ